MMPDNHRLGSRPNLLPTLALALVLIFTLQASRADEGNVGTSMANGFLVTRSPIDAQADIALDVRDMIAAVNDNDAELAKAIYQDGKNSKWYSDTGEYKGIRTLQSLSQDTYLDFVVNPHFIFQVYGIYGKNTFKNLFYADDAISEYLSDATNYRLAPEAVVALNLWMFSVYKLWDSVHDCKNQEDNIRNKIDENPLFENDGLGVYAIDEAMAYWIGSEQDYDTSGYSLYNMAQEMHRSFMTSASSEILSPVNNKLKFLYESSRNEFSSTVACAPGSGTWQKLYHLTNKMVSVMMIPLMQKLIESIVAVDLERMKLYAFAIVPQTAACSPSTHEYLFDKLYNNITDYNAIRDRDEVISKLQSTYDCLGFTCADVGSIGTQHPVCADRPTNVTLAGYEPTFSQYQHARLDLDILQIKVLTRMNSWDLARQLYSLGKNSIIDSENLEYRSLYTLATSSSRSMIKPFYEWYLLFFDDSNYADNVIMGTLDGEGKYALMTDRQQAEIIVKTLSYQVMYMAALSDFQAALNTCRTTGNNLSAERQVSMMESWERGVAMLIGSIEGHDKGGAENSDGVLLYNLANERCEQFGTCEVYPNGKRKAKLVAEYIRLFREGLGYSEMGHCDELQEVFEEIAHLTLVPVLQSVLRYAKLNEKRGADSMSAQMAEGEIYTASVIPFVNHYNTDAANIIADNMVMQPNIKPVRDGAQAVGHVVNEIIGHFTHACSEYFVGPDREKDLIDSIGVNCSLAKSVSSVRSDATHGSGAKVVWMSTLAMILIGLVV